MEFDRRKGLYFRKESEKMGGVLVWRERVVMFGCLGNDKEMLRGWSLKNVIRNGRVMVEGRR